MQVTITDFSFTFMGTGTSAGVPIIACDCAVCTSEDPRDHRSRSGACIRFTDATDQERVILIDTSPDLRAQVLREKLHRCDAIVFTHNHVDHTFGLDEVRRFNMVMQQPIDIYAERSTLDHLHRVFQHVFESHKNINKSFVANLIPNEITVGTPIDLFGLRCTPIRLMHGRLPIVGFRFDHSDKHQALPLAYCTDVSTIPPETWPTLVGLETLVLDMLRIRHHPTHLTLDQAVSIADEIGATQTWFTHMTHCIGHAEVDESLPRGMNLSFDGLCI